MENTNKKSAAAEKEEKILQFWRENKTFEKSLTKDAPKGNYVFYDGPPFATGLPHYGHILGSTAKDVIGRYQTMQGYRVPRKWGWDCHGLPIENIVEKDLGLSGHVEIENLGIDKFVEHARSKVLTYVNEWKRTVERIGRWVDFDGSYKTMDNSFIESVWWALGQMNDKGLLYEGVRVLAYCPRCETPIAKSEIAMDNSYKDIADISVYVNMPLVEDPTVNLIAWTTTPWSLPGDIVLAVKGDATYVKAKIEDKFYVVAKDRAEAVFKDKAYEIVDEFLGSTLVGKKYVPPFDYYTKGEALLSNPKSWTVVAADFVTTTDGTGIAHEAPAFGEDDANLAHKENIPFIVHVTPEGKFAPEVTDFAGMPIKPKSPEKDGHMKADIEILKYLQSKGTLFKKEKIMHSYPHCYRCETPLFYYALPSWFINIQTPKPRMLETAKSMEWIPSHLKDGRFKHTMEGAPDWNISRNRYWASPLPFWKSESGKFLFVNSIEDLKKKAKNSGNTYFIMRHGEADNNIDQVHVPDSHVNAKLTQKGKDTVLENAKNFKGKVDVIICSPYARAQETARITAEAIGYPAENIITDDRFRECDVSSEFDGKSRDILRQYYDVDYASDCGRKFSGGENFEQLTVRLGEFLYDIESKYQNKTILFVGHRASGRALRFVAEGHRFENLSVLKMHDHDLDNAEIREIPFVPLPHNARYELDLHRPYIDEIVLVDEAGEEYKRIPEVIDCWFESGSMPFAQDHYPFERPEWMKENFPAGFVAEYIAQTRTWFYYTHAVSTVLFDAAPFKNVVTTGTLLAEDGQKMSKSKNNFPDPWILFDKYGVDSLRLYLMSSPLMKGEDSNFSEKLVQEIASKVIGRLMNVVTFYELYRDESLEKGTPKSDNVLDKWILARLGQIVEEVTKGMDAYDMTEATRPLDLFVDDLSTWYLRRSRERIKDGESDAKATLYYVLMTVAKIMAPLAPFTAEDIWQRLKHSDMEESVHLATWPEGMKTGDAEVLETMRVARELVTHGLQARQKKGIPVRQPLNELKVKSLKLKAEYIEILKDELNVKNATEDVSLEDEIELDTTITPELKKEGDYRELVRGVQELRKKAGLTPSDTIMLSLSDNAKDFLVPFEEDMKKIVLAKELSYGDVSGEEVRVGEGKVTVTIS
ncbi:MAG: class I tRNA ligase family protein [Candidatus Pacebacteria bacterium]|nr:class I tRNA ligase family protein [Candidatus Paceibacterota bacterium]